MEVGKLYQLSEGLDGKGVTGSNYGGTARKQRREWIWPPNTAVVLLVDTFVLQLETTRVTGGNGTSYSGGSGSGGATDSRT